MARTGQITLRDVAQACGVHLSTISLALHNSPSIPAETRRRIQVSAAALGYLPNVAARNLALHRRQKSAGSALPVAWINQEADRHHWQTDPGARLYFDAARRRAAELGFYLEQVWTGEPGMTPRRVVQIIAARGIQGVLFPVHRRFEGELLHADWQNFSLVGLNDHRLGETTDVICPDYYHNTDLALGRLHQLGFRQIGLVLSPAFDAATSGLVHSSFLRRQSEAPDAFRVPACSVGDELGARNDQLAAWLHRHRPDAVLCADRPLNSPARSSGTGAVWVCLHGEAGPGHVAIDECPADIAVAAVECVAEKMRRFERGVRRSTRVHLIKGVWREAHSVRHELEPVVA